MLRIKGVPDGWRLLIDSLNVRLYSEQPVVIHNSINIPECVKIIENTNILTIEFEDYSGNILYSGHLGIAGASVWRMAGPFIEPLEKQDELWIPSAHSEGSVLPTLECMVNNAVYLSKQYVDEECISRSILQQECIIVNSYEDMIPNTCP